VIVNTKEAVLLSKCTYHVTLHGDSRSTTEEIHYADYLLCVVHGHDSSISTSISNLCLPPGMLSIRSLDGQSQPPDAPRRIA